MTRGASILILAITSEVALIVIAYVLSWLCGIALSWNTSPAALAVGALSAIPLLVGNHVLWRWTQSNPHSVYARFSREIIVPLCREVTPPQALLIGILSGIGEEILFRGALNLIMARWGGLYLACIGSSIAFAWVHFIGNTKRWGGMIPLYTVVGGALWLVWFCTQSLAAAAATHAMYNFLAIVWIRRLTLRAESGVS